MGFLSLFAVGATHVFAATATAFQDVAVNHPFVTAIAVLKAEGVVKGYPNGTFIPDNSISRAEFLTMTMRALGGTMKGTKCFKDVGSEWFAGPVCAAKTKGLIKGYEDGTFKPASNISFAEASSVIANAYELDRSFSVVGRAVQWYEVPVSGLEKAAAIPTTIDYVQKNISRGEMAEMIWRLKTKNTSKPTKTLASLESSFPTISSCPELEEKARAFSVGHQGYRGRIMYKGIMPLMAEPMAMDGPPLSGGDAAESAATTAAPAPSNPSKNARLVPS